MKITTLYISQITINDYQIYNMNKKLVHFHENYQQVLLVCNNDLPYFAGEEEEDEEEEGEKEGEEEEEEEEEEEH